MFAFLYGRQWAGYEIVQGIRQFGVRIQQEQNFFLFSEKSVPALGLTKTPIQLVPGFFPGVPGLGADADLSSPSGTEINHNWRQTFTQPIGLQGVDRDNIKFFHH